jgi:hypothetical protein
MLLAMLAMTVGWPVVHPLVWAASLLALAVVGAAGHRVRRKVAAAAHVRHMQLHRTLGLVLGAALLAVSSTGHAGASIPVHSNHVGAGSPLVVALAGTTAYLVFTAWIVARSIRRRSPLVGTVEASAMGLMTALMAVAALVG